MGKHSTNLLQGIFTSAAREPRVKRFIYTSSSQAATEPIQTENFQSIRTLGTRHASKKHVHLHHIHPNEHGQSTPRAKPGQRKLFGRVLKSRNLRLPRILFYPTSIMVPSLRTVKLLLLQNGSRVSKMET